jgi:dihydroflavonol-4-reductase
VLTSATHTASPSSYREEGVSDETVWTDVDARGYRPIGGPRRSRSVPPGISWKAQVPQQL